MPYENGVNWQPKSPRERGRHATFNAALEAAYKDLVTEKNPFFDSLAEEWRRIFPSLAARPGRYEDGKIVLYVKNPPTLFAMRMKLGMIRAKLAALPSAPKRIELKLEIHSS
jgi:hypothetical protein